MPSPPSDARCFSGWLISAAVAATSPSVALAHAAARCAPASAVSAMQAPAAAPADGRHGPASPPDAATDQRSRLVEGVRRIAVSGVPGPVVLSGTPGGRVFAVVAGTDDRLPATVVGASLLGGGGRAIAWGHDGYLNPATLEAADTGRLMERSIRWLARADLSQPAAAPIRVAVIGTHGGKGFADWLNARAGFAAESISAAQLGADRLRDVRVVVLAHERLTPEQAAAVRAVALRGGGVLGAGLGWGWLQLNPGKRIEDHPLNAVLGPLGLLIADGTVAADGGAFAVVDPLPRADLLTLAGAINHLQAAPPAGPNAAADLATASATVTRAVQTARLDDPNVWPGIQRITAARTGAGPGGAGAGGGGGGERGQGVPVPGTKSPVGRAAALDRVLIAADWRRRAAWARGEDRGVVAGAHPAAAEFPGSVPAAAPRVTRAIELPGDQHGWISTGLYAAAGETIRVRTSPAGVDARLELQIGSHTDGIWHLESWQRVPEVVVRRAIDKPEVTLRSPMGGLVYVAKPEGGPGPGAAAIKVEIGGAVDAPRFVLGQTTDERWRESERNKPGPWAEFQTRKVILTVPSEVARRVDDPEALMRFWDDVLDAQADLATIPRDRPRPERIVADVQISAGYMHSGYPIMTHMDAGAFMTTLADLRVGKNAWGLFHELGHNHQSSDWTFDGTGEVTVNLFTLYALERVTKLPEGDRGHPGVNAPPRAIRKFWAEPKFDVWKGDPFLALWMYVQMRDEFGWQPFKDVFAEYRALPAADRPNGEQAKRDQWMLRFSRRVGRDLGPFFQAWGVPTSDAARRQLNDLPAWMPQMMTQPGR